MGFDDVSTLSTERQGGNCRFKALPGERTARSSDSLLPCASDYNPNLKLTEVQFRRKIILRLASHPPDHLAVKLSGKLAMGSSLARH